MRITSVVANRLEPAASPSPSPRGRTVLQHASFRNDRLSSSFEPLACDKRRRYTISQVTRIWGCDDYGWANVLRRSTLVRTTRDPNFQNVVDKYAGLISRISLSFEADPVERQDLKQEIFIAVWQSLPHFRGESSERTYVATIAQKRAISHVSRRARVPKFKELSDDIASIETRQDEVAIELDTRSRVIRVVQTLPLAQKETVILLLEGFNYSEISQILGISVNAAMLRCQRAKEILKRILGNAA